MKPKNDQRNAAMPSAKSTKLALAIRLSVLGLALFTASCANRPPVNVTNEGVAVASCPIPADDATDADNAAFLDCQAQRIDQCNAQITAGQ